MSAAASTNKCVTSFGAIAFSEPALRKSIGNANSRLQQLTGTRHCEEAKPTKQSRSRARPLDCFAALAKTGVGSLMGWNFWRLP